MKLKYHNTKITHFTTTPAATAKTSIPTPNIGTIPAQQMISPVCLPKCIMTSPCHTSRFLWKTRELIRSNSIYIPDYGSGQLWERGEAQKSSQLPKICTGSTKFHRKQAPLFLASILKCEKVARTKQKARAKRLGFSILQYLPIEVQKQQECGCSQEESQKLPERTMSNKIPWWVSTPFHIFNYLQEEVVQ